MKSVFNLLVMLLLASPLGAALIEVPEPFYKALHLQESSGKLNPPDGDKGKAIGPFQIWYSYWADAHEFDKTLGGTYQDCRNMEYARRVVRAYMNRHERTALRNRNYEHLARAHNGGCKWRLKPTKTDKYWNELRNKL
jgi:hypothetical protein